MTIFPGATKEEVDSLDARIDILEASLARGALPVFDVTDPAYGGVMNATTNAQRLQNIAALKAVYNAVWNAGGGIIYFPRGVFDIGATTGTDHSLELKTSSPNTVQFVGAGRRASYIKLGGVVSAFLAGVATAANYDNIDIRSDDRREQRHELQLLVQRLGRDQWRLQYAEVERR
jgi:hypothetical protein